MNNHFLKKSRFSGPLDELHFYHRKVRVEQFRGSHRDYDEYDISLHELPVVLKQMTAVRPPIQKMVGACYVSGTIDGEATANLSVQGEYDDETQTFSG